MKRPAWFRKDDVIVTAWAELCTGPGWANTPIWVIVSNNNELRRECLQPNEQDHALRQLFGISCAVQAAMLKALEPTKRGPG